MYEAVRKSIYAPQQKKNRKKSKRKIETRDDGRLRVSSFMEAHEVASLGAKPIVALFELPIFALYFGTGWGYSKGIEVVAVALSGATWLCLPHCIRSSDSASELFWKISRKQDI